MYEYDGKPARMFRFVEALRDNRGHKVYIFQRPMKNDSRVEQITCHASWFWTGK